MTFKGFEKHEAVLETSVSKGKRIPLHTCHVPFRVAAPDGAFTSSRLKSTFRASRRNTGATPEKRGQIRINKRRAGDSLQIARRFETREERVCDFASRHAFLAVTGGNIARPVTNVLTIRPILHSQKNGGMSVLVSANGA